MCGSGLVVLHPSLCSFVELASMHEDAVKLEVWQEGHMGLFYTPQHIASRLLPISLGHCDRVPPEPAAAVRSCKHLFERCTVRSLIVCISSLQGRQGMLVRTSSGSRPMRPHSSLMKIVNPMCKAGDQHQQPCLTCTMQIPRAS